MGCTVSREIDARGHLKSIQGAKVSCGSVLNEKHVKFADGMEACSSQQTLSVQGDVSAPMSSASSAERPASCKTPSTGLTTKTPVPSTTAPTEEPEFIQPYDEDERVQTLLSLCAINTPEDSRFDEITALMRKIFNTPVAALTLVATDVIHMRSRAGQWACSAPRKGSFCDWILDGQQPRMVVVEDALKDKRFSKTRFVVGPPHVRFYAGAPLVGSTGHRYGALCIIDFVPRAFEPQDYLALCHFAELAVRELERDALHEATCSELRAQLENSQTRTGRVLRAIDAVDEAVLMTDVSHPEWPIVYANSAWGRMTSCDPTTLSLCSADSQLNPSPWASFWSLFAGKVLDPTEAGAALAAVQSGKPFMLSLRNSDAPSGVITLRFKPITESGPLGDATMPAVALPVGLEKDRGCSNKRMSPAPQLSDEKRAALAAALAALSGVPTTATSSPNISTDTHDTSADVINVILSGLNAAAPSTVPEEEEEEEQIEETESAGRGSGTAAEASSAASPSSITMAPQASFETTTNSAATTQRKSIYYLGVVVRSEPVQRGSQTHAVRLSAALNNAVGAIGDAPADVAVEGGGGGGGVVVEDHQQRAEEQRQPTPPPSPPASATVAHGSLPFDALKRSTRSLHDAVAQAAAVAACAPPTAVVVHEKPPQPVATLDTPPSALGPVTLTTLIGQNSTSRSYRGTWMGTRVAIKVSESLECSSAGGAGARGEIFSRQHSGTSTIDTAASSGSGVEHNAVMPSHPALLPVYACYTVVKSSTSPSTTPTSSGILRSSNSSAASSPVVRQVWSVRKFADRGNLTDAINYGAFRGAGGSLDVPCIVLTARDVAIGMEYLHSNRNVHGALTSANVLLISDAADECRGWTALLSDPCGSAHSSSSSNNNNSARNNREEYCCGSVTPAPPALPLSAQMLSASHLPAEILLGGKLTQQADVYSFGVLVWEMLHGRQAWRGLAPSQVLQFVALEGCQLPPAPPECPPALAKLLEQCLHGDPRRRPSFIRICEVLNNMVTSYNLAVE